MFSPKIENKAAVLTVPLLPYCKSEPWNKATKINKRRTCRGWHDCLRGKAHGDDRKAPRSNRGVQQVLKVNIQNELYINTHENTDVHPPREFQDSTSLWAGEWCLCVSGDPIGYWTDASPMGEQMRDQVFCSHLAGPGQWDPQVPKPQHLVERVTSEADKWHLRMGGQPWVGENSFL